MRPARPLSRPRAGALALDLYLPRARGTSAPANATHQAEKGCGQARLWQQAYHCRHASLNPQIAVQSACGAGGYGCRAGGRRRCPALQIPAESELSANAPFIWQFGLQPLSRQLSEARLFHVPPAAWLLLGSPLRFALLLPWWLLVSPVWAAICSRRAADWHRHQRAAALLLHGLVWELALTTTPTTLTTRTGPSDANTW